MPLRRKQVLLLRHRLQQGQRANKPSPAPSGAGPTFQDCLFVTKSGAIEGGSDESYEALVIPLFSACTPIVPAVMLIIASFISNERTLLGMLEMGKIFLMLSVSLLVISVLEVNRLTFDCRWYSETATSNTNRTNCRSGHQKVVMGAILLFVCEGCLTLAILIMLEMERKRVRDPDCDGVFESTIPTVEIRQMAPSGPLQGWGKTPQGWGSTGSTVTVAVRGMPAGNQSRMQGANVETEMRPQPMGSGMGGDTTSMGQGVMGMGDAQASTSTKASDFY